MDDADDTVPPEGVWKVAISKTERAGAKFVYNRKRGKQLWAEDVVRAHNAWSEHIRGLPDYWVGKESRPELTKEGFTMLGARLSEPAVLPPPVPDTTQKIKKRYCNAYQAVGYCKWGKECKFLHELNLCRQYFRRRACDRRRTCDYGERCHRLHDIPQWALERRLCVVNNGV